MAEIIYALQFKGKGTPVPGSPSVIKAATNAQSSTITSTAGPQGVSGSIAPAGGGRASFESTVTITGEATFQESGTIAFGPGHRLRFTTVGQGHLGPSPQAGVMHGSVMWRVEGGEGQFDGAQGLITSNFTFTESGDVVDNQFGVLFVK
jgi:hypothetical protein